MMGAKFPICILFLAVLVTWSERSIVVSASCRSKNEWRGRTVYQLLTDRFSTDSGTGGTCANAKLYDVYCGGTFKGIQNNLDYITGMGFDAIWISPIAANTLLGYHGYWPKNLYEVNSFFASSNDAAQAARELKELVAAAHERNVWVMLDIVPNHMGGPHEYNITSFHPFNDASHFHSCDSSCADNCPTGGCSDGRQCSCQCGPSCAIHPSDYDVCDCTERGPGGVEECQQGGGLVDLDQSNEFVRANYSYWVQWVEKEFDIDGFRVDSAKHVSKDFWQHLQTQTGCYMMGEVLQGAPCFVGQYQRVLDGLQNYPLYYTLLDVFGYRSGYAPGGASSMAQLGSKLQEIRENFLDASALGNFVENQDTDRWLTVQADPVLTKSALTFLLFSDGIPIVYYGLEQAYGSDKDGTNDQSRNRKPLWWGEGLSTTSALYKTIAALTSLRKQQQVWKYEQKEASHGFGVGARICNWLAWGDCLTTSAADGSFPVVLNDGEQKVFILATAAQPRAFISGLALPTAAQAEAKEEDEKPEQPEKAPQGSAAAETAGGAAAAAVSSSSRQHWLQQQEGRLKEPTFVPEVLAANVSDSYFIEGVDVNNDGLTDVIHYGLRYGEVVWFENPSWKKRSLALLSVPVGMDHADVDGDGWTDVAITYDYGECIRNCDAAHGKVAWLRNPGAQCRGNFDHPTCKGNWTLHYIGHLVAPHRLAFGYFTQTQSLQLLGLPVVGDSGVHSPIRVTLYTPPARAHILSADEGWPAEVVIDSLHVIHGVTTRRFAPTSDADAAELDSVLLASQEGVGWLRFDPASGAWAYTNLGTGEVGEVERNQTEFFGSGDVDVLKLGGDPFAAIATLEPFHGNTVAVYSRGDDGGLAGEVVWERDILDVFKDPDGQGEGPGHHVKAADFDGDGDDEFLVAFRGPFPWQGVFYYKHVPTPYGPGFIKTRVSSASAGRIVVADFDNDGRLDFATTGYYVPRYFLSEDPSTLVFYNDFATTSGPRPYHPADRPSGGAATAAGAAASAASTEVTVADGVVTVTLPVPTTPVAVSPAWSIGDWELQVVQVARGSSFTLPRGSSGVTARSYIKVVAGSLFGLDQAGSVGPVGAPNQRRSNAVPAGCSAVQAGPAGAIFVLWTATFAPGNSKVRSMTGGKITRFSGPGSEAFKWRLYSDVDPTFKGVDFWNLRGLRVQTQQGRRVVFLQFWAVNNGVSAGWHDHSNLNVSTAFGEVHQMLYEGSGHGGMQYRLPCPKSAGGGEYIEKLLPLPVGYEHGPLWFVNSSTGEPLLSKQTGALVYPTHRWIGGGVSTSPSAYDVWVVYEMPPPAVNVPLYLLAGDIAHAVL
eukprot:jgi/Mesen1/6943/ME000036S06271